MAAFKNATGLFKQIQRNFAGSAGTSKFVLPDLPYDYGALEPAITGQIMETHHKKHHQTYVTNLNNSMSTLQSAESTNDISKILSVQSAIKFNGGGHLNHSIFWTNLAPSKQGGGDESKISSKFQQTIQSQYKSIDNLKQLLTTAGLGVQGSGWAWLGLNSSTKQLEITTRANQDPLVELVPLLGIDVWEHAYYYKYGPARAEYLKNIWSVINWQNVNERYEKATSQ